jgi:hypothetical protein
MHNTQEILTRKFSRNSSSPPEVDCFIPDGVPRTLDFVYLLFFVGFPVFDSLLPLIVMYFPGHG